MCRGWALFAWAEGKTVARYLSRSIGIPMLYLPGQCQLCCHTLSWFCPAVLGHRAPRVWSSGPARVGIWPSTFLFGVSEHSDQLWTGLCKPYPGSRPFCPILPQNQRPWKAPPRGLHRSGLGQPGPLPTGTPAVPAFFSGWSRVPGGGTPAGCGCSRAH